MMALDSHLRVRMPPVTTLSRRSQGHMNGRLELAHAGAGAAEHGLGGARGGDEPAGLEGPGEALWSERVQMFHVP